VRNCRPEIELGLRAKIQNTVGLPNKFSVPKEVTFIAAKSLFPMNRLIGGPTDGIKFIWQFNHETKIPHRAGKIA